MLTWTMAAVRSRTAWDMIWTSSSSTQFCKGTTLRPLRTVPCSTSRALVDVGFPHTMTLLTSDEWMASGSATCMLFGVTLLPVPTAGAAQHRKSAARETMLESFSTNQLLLFEEVVPSMHDRSRCNSAPVLKRSQSTTEQTWVVFYGSSHYHTEQEQEGCFAAKVLWWGQGYLLN